MVVDDLPPTHRVDVDGPSDRVVADSVGLEDVIRVPGCHHGDAVGGDVGDLQHQIEQDRGDLAAEDVETSRVGHLDPGISGNFMGEDEIVEVVEDAAGRGELVELPTRFAHLHADVQGPDY